MITVVEIQKKSERKYEEVLRDSLNGESCFPLEIRSNKVLSKDFIQMSKEIAEVLGGSKDRKGFGYSVVSETIKTRQHGIQDIPKSIVYETLDDYLKFIKKEKEFHVMMENYSFIKSELPQLESWLKENPKAIIDNSDVWPGLIKVCQWFILHFEPDKYYIRELPIPVHTKFIEENKGILRLLLDELVPDIVNTSENHFEKRFFLKYDQSLIRFRLLDKSCWGEISYDDITIPIEQFKSTTLKCSRVFIIENKMNFLAFPKVSHSIAIWGKGFAVDSLKNTDWLEDKEIYYWSDMDIQGFQMLSQLRSYFPQTKSFLMEREILENYCEFIVSGTVSKVVSLAHLSGEELEVYKLLSKSNVRLEQERVDQCFISERLNQMFLRRPS
ncbi:Wadjet anti-phage system protein JetD domain-containing protein [Cytophagales bacterium EPR-FJ-38]